VIFCFAPSVVEANNEEADAIWRENLVGDRQTALAPDLFVLQWNNSLVIFSRHGDFSLDRCCYLEKRLPGSQA
jgi:hypothetical protein